MCNGIVLGLRFSHTVLDRTGAGTLLKVFALCCRGLPAAELPTNAEKENASRDMILHATLPDNRRRDHDEEYTIDPLAFEMLVDVRTRDSALKETCSAILHERGIDPMWVSSNDVFTAFLAVSISQAQISMNRPPKESDIVMAVNLRNKLQPSVPGGYLENMVTVMRTGFNPRLCHCNQVDDERKSRIAQLALKVRARLTSCDDDHVRSLILYVKDQNDWSTVNMKFSGMMSIASWRHLKACGLDFGSGFGSVRFDVPTVGAPDGLCIFMPRQAKAESDSLHDVPWDRYLSLDSAVMDALIQDPFFRSALAEI
ncbi:hypothetical protein Asppvi_001722 [Aspergillus pseudoviridinutans]|uniref:Transferase family-domain-containing protein n=1 Tax=Aspergillus pseudoviridinutans TaxID=1517512 RepID=A0A9P3B5L0_9EURO|nr:uncharacterized protein Asppvi_001722 [Aspergillus pseudoviridinutans]GIJ83203.1 hypothetical protein Asppvi_001722 [Aspergillus pseudoviridinutans]